jgi:hypothetical protein
LLYAPLHTYDKRVTKPYWIDKGVREKVPVRA